MSRACTVVALSFLAFQVAAQPTCPFTISSDADTMSAPCTWVSGNTWDIDIDLSHSGTTAVLNLVVGRADDGSRPSIRNLYISVNQTTGYALNVTTTLSGASPNLYELQDLASLEVDPEATGNVFLELYAFGSVGFIECQRILDGSEVFGDVTDGIHLDPMHRSGVAYAEIERLHIGGDLLGDVRSVGAGHLSVLEVDGDIGTPASPIVVDMGPGGGVGTISCTNFYADKSPL